MKIRTFFALFSLMTATTIFAQSGSLPAALQKVTDTKLAAVPLVDGVLGSPLLLEAAVPARIWLASQPTVPVEATINLNTEKQWMVVQLAGGKTGLVRYNHVKRFEFLSEPTWSFAVRSDVTSATSKNQVCYQVLYQGKHVFYKHLIKKIETISNGKQSYRARPLYYIQAPGGTFKAIELTRASVEAALPQSVAQIAAFMAQRPNNTFNETVIVELMRFLDK